nr:hypothetical protein [Pseudoalteromonas sp. WY3]
MEKIFLKLIEVLEKVVGEIGLWIISILIAVFLLFLIYERFIKSRLASSSNNFKKFELFIKVFDGKIEDKNPLLIEQGFSNYFGYALSFDEIKYCFSLERPTEFINDLARSRYFTHFSEQKYEETVKLEIRKNVASIIYWLSAISGLGCFIALMITDDIGWLILSILSFLFVFTSLKSLISSHAGLRVVGKYYAKRNSESLIFVASTAQ